MFVLRRTVLLCLGLLLTTSIISSADAAPKKPKKNFEQYAALGYVPNEVLVKFKPHTRLANKAAAHRRVRAKELRKNKFGDFSLMQLPKGSNVNKVAETYKKNKHVEWAEPNYIRRVSFVPDDPKYPQQWHLYNPTYLGINVEGAWDITMGDPSVVVAVVDTGVAYEDYDENGDGFYDYLKAPDLVNTLFCEGFDFINDDKHANDDHGHGTVVAGVIAQSTNNALGCAGVAPNVTIMPVKVFDSWGYADAYSVASGVYYAAYEGATVINMSYGGSYPSSAERSACNAAYKMGATLIAATGNDGSPYIAYPAGYDEYVIAVGATGQANELTYYSNYGWSFDYIWYGFGSDKGIDLVAPGGDLLEDLDEDGEPDGIGILQNTMVWGNPFSFTYEHVEGTSAACPHVAGVAALVQSMGVTDPDLVRLALETTATDLGMLGYDYEYGWGLVNAEAAVLAAQAGSNEEVVADAGPDQTLTDYDGDGMEPVVLDGSGSTYDPSFPIVSYRWVDEGRELGTGMTITRDLAVGTHTIALYCTDSRGNTSLDTTTITIEPGPPGVKVYTITLEGYPYKSQYYLLARVTITDEQNRPVYRARVSGAWSGDYIRTMRPLYTNSRGEVVFPVGEVSGGTYTFTVTGVARAGYTYRPDLNAETSDTLTIP